MDVLHAALDFVNGVLWHDSVIYTLLFTGLLFTVWSVFIQYVSLSHGIRIVRGEFDSDDDPGAISHFEALSAALSATVGLGNIAGVAVAVALGGPGAVFYMWIVGFVGMALKATEVTLAMLYRNTEDAENPHGGPMWVVYNGLKDKGPGLARLGKIVGGIFCVTLLISAVTGGNMFQAWNVAEVTHNYFPGIPRSMIGIVLAILVGAVIIGGIKRIGAVAGKLVPAMCGLYLAAAFYVVFVNIEAIPSIFRLIITSAFAPTEAAGAFVGGTWGYAMMWGMKRALFSSEAGQGSAPIAHAAARSDEPVREGIVAGLEPFIDTLVVCTLTALVVLSSGAWNRDAPANFAAAPSMVQTSDGSWTPETHAVPPKSDEAAAISDAWQVGDGVFMIVSAGLDASTGGHLHKVTGTIGGTDAAMSVEWDSISTDSQPTISDTGLYMNLAGAALTSHAFDRVAPGLGMWLVTLAAWLFALSTMISWSYYGEQGLVFLFGQNKRVLMAYKVIYCLLVVVSTLGFIKTDAELDTWTALGTGVMLVANIPIMLAFGPQAMRAYHSYMKRLRAGEFAKR